MKLSPYVWISVLAMGSLEAQDEAWRKESPCVRLEGLARGSMPERLDLLRKVLVELQRAFADLAAGKDLAETTPPWRSASRDEQGRLALGVEFSDEAELRRVVRQAGGVVAYVAGQTAMVRVGERSVDALEKLGRVWPEGTFSIPQGEDDGERKGDWSPWYTSHLQALGKLHARGLTGKGVRIGVIDVGFASLCQAPRPEWVGGCRETGAQPVGNPNHGWQSAQVIHQIAPEATLFLASAQQLQGEVGAAADWLAAQRVDVINFSGGSLAYRPDGRSDFDDIVAKYNQALWFISTGNEAKGHWSGDLTEYPIPIDFWNGFSNRILLLGDQPYGCVGENLTKVGDFRIYLEQRSPQEQMKVFFFAVKEDFSVEYRGGHALKSTTRAGLKYDVIPTSHRAGEELGFVLVSFEPHGQTSAKGPRWGRVVHSGFGRGRMVFPHEPRGSIRTPATADAAMAVGAVKKGTVADFSGGGPRTDGAKKPELVSFAEPYDGTSTAAPNATGIAALVAQQSAGLRGGQLREWVMRLAAPLPSSQDFAGAGLLSATALEAATRDWRPPAPVTPVQPAPVQPAPVKPSSFSSLRELRRAPAPFPLRVSLDRAEYAIGENIQLTLTGEGDGWGELHHLDSNGNVEVVESRIELRSGRPVRFEFRAAEPAGEEEFVLVYAQTEAELRERQGAGVASARLRIR